MTEHNLSDFPWVYHTSDGPVEDDNSDNVRKADKWVEAGMPDMPDGFRTWKPSDKSGKIPTSDILTSSGDSVQDWHNDPNHNVEPKSDTSDTPPLLPVTPKMEALLNRLEADRVRKSDKSDKADKSNIVDETVELLKSDPWGQAEKSDKADTLVIPITLTEYLASDNRVKSDTPAQTGTPRSMATRWTFQVESPELDENTRILTAPEFDAIESFRSKWGYSGNTAFTDDVIGLLERDDWTNSDILAFLGTWGMSDDRDREGMSDDLRNMLNMGATGNLHRYPETLESDNRTEPTTAPEQNESDKPLNSVYKDESYLAYKSVLKDEKDTRVERLFVGKQGEIWVVWHITDIPAGTDDPDYDHLLTTNGWGMPASDGTITMVNAHPFLTRDRAYRFISGVEDDSSKFDWDGTILTHVYELGQM